MNLKEAKQILDSFNDNDRLSNFIKALEVIEKAYIKDNFETTVTGRIKISKNYIPTMFNYKDDYYIRKTPTNENLINEHRLIEQLEAKLYDALCAFDNIEKSYE